MDLNRLQARASQIWSTVQPSVTHTRTRACMINWEMFLYMFVRELYAASEARDRKFPTGIAFASLVLATSVDI